MKHNPIIKNMGICDPHIHFFEGKAYLYASHDADKNNRDWIMKDWHIYSSEDLITWNLESIILPEDTYLKKCSRCWAVDCAEKNGKYYLYFSKGNEEIGVLVSDYPGRGFHDVLKKPLINKKMTDTLAYDPTVFVDDDGSAYIIFGCASVNNYQISKLNDDMISLAEKPIKIILKESPVYDDKSYLHKYNGRYYLSYGSFYAVSDSVYGPYTYVDSIKVSYDHGNFFEFNGQWYNAFTIPDPTTFHRATGLTYVHYDKKGRMYCDGLINEYGVGSYDANWNKIEAEWYSKGLNIDKIENGFKGFDVEVNDHSVLFFQNIENMSNKNKIIIYGVTINGLEVIVRDTTENGDILGILFLEAKMDMAYYNYTNGISKLAFTCKNLCLTFRGEGRIDYFLFA